MDALRGLRGHQIEVRRHSDRLRRFKREREQSATITKWCLDVALCISCILSCDFVAGVEWLQSKQSRGAPLPSEINSTELEEWLQEDFLKADVGRLMSWVDVPTCVLPATVLWTARLLSKWFREMNVVQVVLVRAERFIEQFNASISVDSVANLLLASVREQQHPTGRKWAQRWRTKHGVVVGRLRAREEISNKEMHDKASTL